MNIERLLCIVATSFLWFEFVECFLPLMPAAVVGGAAALFGGYHAIKCRFQECCDDHYIPADFQMLNEMMKTRLYGQQIAHDTVLHALSSHFSSTQSRKALAMSFHGMPGSGKNYLSGFIMKALYREGDKSKYVHMFKGRIDFPSNDKVQEYKETLTNLVINSLSKCPKSLFIFDEVDKMPEGVLNALVPFLDYHAQSRSTKGSDPTNATFIFLSNTGGTLIVKHLIQLWEQGKKREQTKLQDFESLIAIGAFNEKGGFHRSDTIEASLIDHYVPFLPLEESHVRGCLKDAFLRRGVAPTDEMMEEALSHVTFGPAPYNLYANAVIIKHLIQLWKIGQEREQTELQDFESLIAIGAFNERGGFYRSDTIEASLIDLYANAGCKRIEQKLASIVHRSDVRFRHTIVILSIGIS